MKSSYEVERDFQAQQAAQDILDNLNIQCGGASPSKSNRSYPGSNTGSIGNEVDCTIPSAKTTTPTSNPESYLYIPTTAGNFLMDREVQPRRMAARRLFSVCCVFDVLLIAIVWAIASVMNGEKLNDAIKEQIEEFHYKKSTADLMLLSLLRCIIYVIHYWIIKSKLQITIIVVTIASTTYVFVKLPYLVSSVSFNVIGKKQDEVMYLVILVSFIMCWVEVWLFESKVLKAENQVTRILRPNIYNGDDAQQPLLSRVYTVAGSDFNYSAFQTPAASIPPTPGGYKGKQDDKEISRLDPRGQMLYNVAMQAQNELHETVLWPDGWTTEKDEKDGIKVFSRAQRKAPNRLFLSECHYHCTLDDMFEVLYKETDAPGWNKQILQFDVVEVLTSHLDIVYSVGTGGAGGLIKSREFLTLRYWMKDKDTYFIVNRDISDPVKPASSLYPRGFNGPCGYVFFPDLDGSVKLTYVLNVDLKIPFVPQKVINSALTDVIHDFHVSLRTKVDEFVVQKHRAASDRGYS